MADIIHLLPDSVANQIAAGEVILRPASAVKELLENSVDAGATEVNLVIKDSGKTLVQVVDNGSGMSERDARMSFERHATSKIRQANDLFAIRTLGFRGEALASIAAIAQVEMKTRRHDEELGTLLLVEGSKVKEQSHCSCPAGTSIQVKNLFYNVPARRSFLKTDTAEFRHILDEFFRVALVYHDIRFTLHHNSKIIHQLYPSGRKQRIAAIFGNTYNERLVGVDHVTEAMSVTGFIGKPEFARKTRGEQFFFVNGRYIRHPYLHHSIDSAYRELIPSDAIPSYFIYIETDPGTIDINIHPTKTEINFLDHQVIYAVIRSAVRQALGLHNVLPSINFDVEQSLDFTPPSPGTTIRNPFNTPQSGYNPFETGNEGAVFQGQSQKKPEKGWEKMFDFPERGLDESPELSIPEEPDLVRESVFQFQNAYVVSSIKSGLLIIDQQRAHERILYEHYLEMLRRQTTVVQQELFPVQVSFSMSDAELLDDIREEMSLLGFHLNKLGKNTFVVTGLIESMLDQYKKNLVDLRLDKNANLARTLAVSLSIRKGQKLHTEEMIHLISELFSCEAPESTPDGKKTFTVIPSQELETIMNR